MSELWKGDKGSSICYGRLCNRAEEDHRTLRSGRNIDKLATGLPVSAHTPAQLSQFGVEMHRVFQTYIDRLSESTDEATLRESMAEVTRALDLSCFAYLRTSGRNNATPLLISTYPSAWTAQYLKNHYECLDPVIDQVLKDTEPFQWGLGSRAGVISRPQRELFEAAAGFGITCGFTIPIHDGRGPIAAVTFAADERRGAAFFRRVEAHRRVLQLMAMYFHSHVRGKLSPDRVIDGVSLSPREFECLRWAAQGKSAWETGQILGISRHTVATHLENAKTKLGVRTIVQAVARVTSSKLIGQRPIG
jgi:LuxR family transcriptional activator of conjugal transfer of Ti plasmids